MPAGYNMRFQLFSVTQQADDAIGGAQASGTLNGEYWGRMREAPPSQLLLQQGVEFEVPAFIRCPANVPAKQYDEVQISYPTDHYAHGDRYKVTNLHRGTVSSRDRRGQIELTVWRRKFSRGDTY